MKAVYTVGGVLIAIAAAAFLIPHGTCAAEKSQDEIAKGREVEFFTAMDAGDIDVKFIAKNSKQANVSIKNNTKEALSVKLPDVFAGVPVLAQRGRNGGGGGGGGRNGQQGGQNQTTGGGMGGMGGMGGGMFNVPAEKVAKFDVKTVCLEHGKADPKPTIPYEIKPITTVTDKPGVAEVCKMLGKNQTTQSAAQAAAWHLNNGMTWDELAAKKREYPDGFTESYFSSEEMQTAAQVANSAQTEAAAKKPAATSADDYARYQSPGETQTTSLPAAK